MHMWTSSNKYFPPRSGRATEAGAWSRAALFISVCHSSESAADDNLFIRFSVKCFSPAGSTAKRELAWADSDRYKNTVYARGRAGNIVLLCRVLLWPLFTDESRRRTSSSCRLPSSCRSARQRPDWSRRSETHLRSKVWILSTDLLVLMRLIWKTFSFSSVPVQLSPV